MPKLVLPPRARRDINAILIYIAHQSGSAEVGLNFAKLLRDQCAQLASF